LKFHGATQVLVDINIIDYHIIPIRSGGLYFLRLGNVTVAMPHRHSCMLL